MARPGPRLAHANGIGCLVCLRVFIGHLHSAGHSQAHRFENNADLDDVHDWGDALVGHRQSHQRLWLFWRCGETDQHGDTIEEHRTVGLFHRVGHMADEDVAKRAGLCRTTRAWASMEKAAELSEDCIFAVGNAPTALVRLYELIKEGRIHPKLIVGVPVGFVNVVQSKEMILSLADVPYIVAKGRKGGSNVAAAIINALLYQI